MRILVTGGAGYIGSHTAIRLLETGYDVTILDDLSSGHKEAVDRIEQLTGKKIELYVGDISDRVLLRKLFAASKIDAVIHFAGKKSVEDSVTQAAYYFAENVGGTAVLCNAMQEAGVSRIVYSSTCQVYGDKVVPALHEEMSADPVNPYGDTKYCSEKLLQWLAIGSGWSSVALRYFNPIGAHESGMIGEDQKNAKNIIPILLEIADGKRAKLQVFGTDYPTPDGTCLRDYIHIMDLADAHISAMEWATKNRGWLMCNVGNGIGGSVFDIRTAFEQACGKPIPFETTARRAGDPAILVADPTKAQSVLGWSGKLSLFEACHSAWQWHLKNPDGYVKR
ncbi:MAG: UDP-glucose 4-epimerase GalE [bacterium]|nr:UDP-glucose 4-epimerase GalE [bacterium]